jgi:DNA sulfur modification protein DndD
LIINELKINNFRSFYGEHKLTFSNNINNKVNVFIADNGGGKTTLINSIYWCLTGGLTPSVEQKQGVINSFAVEDNLNAACWVEIVFENHSRKYRLRRTISNGQQNSQLSFFHINDDGISIDQGNPQLAIDSIFPKSLTKWFFYDAEAFKELTLSGSSEFKNDLRRSLGFENIDICLDYLEKAKNKFIRASKNLTDADGLAELETRLQSYLDQLPSLKNTYEDIEKDFKKAKDDYDAAEAEFRKIEKTKDIQGTIDAEKLNLKSYQRECENLKKYIARFEGEAFPEIFMHEEMSTLMKDFDVKQHSGKFPSPIDKTIIHDIQQSGECSVCKTPVDEKMMNEIIERLSSSTTSTFNERIANLKTAITTIKESYQNFHSKIRKLKENDLPELEKNISDTKGIIKKLENSISIMTDEEVQDILNKKNKADKNRFNLNSQYIQAKDFYDTQKKAYDDLQADYNKQKLQKGISDENKKTIEKLRIITEFITNKAEEQEKNCLEILENEINKILSKDLLKDYIAKIKSKDYSIELINSLGKEVDKSGGEGELLKYIFVSSILSLSRSTISSPINFLAEPFVAPLAIDAPFTALGNRYTESAAKCIIDSAEQLILIMLPKAYNDSKIQKVIKNNIGKKCKIIFKTKKSAKEWKGDLSLEKIDGLDQQLVFFDENIEGSFFEEIK